MLSFQDMLNHHTGDNDQDRKPDHSSEPLINRRDFFKASAFGAILAWSDEASAAKDQRLKETAEVGNDLSAAGTVRTICTYCSLGCGLVSRTTGSDIIDLAGDPEHPINAGKLCLRGQAQAGYANYYLIPGHSGPNKARATKLSYRPKAGRAWQDISWDKSLRDIVKRIKDTRDKYFITSEGGSTVNRADAIAVICGQDASNEAAYLIQKLSRALGVIDVHSESWEQSGAVTCALAATFGLPVSSGEMSKLADSGLIIDLGANLAESQPVAMRFIRMAQDNGARYIYVDTRLGRSAVAGRSAVIRPGTLLAFIAGLIAYLIDHRIYDEAFIAASTDASFLVDPNYALTDGLFSGYRVKERRYDSNAWSYQIEQLPGQPAPSIKSDPSIINDSCVLNIIKRHFLRYDPETVAKITGLSSEEFAAIAEAVAEAVRNGQPVGTVLSGQLLDNAGTQTAKAAVMLGLLLGDPLKPGAGLFIAHEGGNAQGIIDQGVWPQSLPGYQLAPLEAMTPDLNSYFGPHPDAWLTNRGESLISYLKAIYGDFAQPQNAFAYELLPKQPEVGNLSITGMFQRMLEGKIKGLILWSADPVVSTANANIVLEALQRLDWLIVIDSWPNRTAEFWKHVSAGNKTGTEIFFIPTALPFECGASVTTAGQRIQLCRSIIDPPSGVMTMAEIADELYRSLRSAYSTILGKFPEAITNLKWDYASNRLVEDVAREMSGYFLIDGRPIINAGDLRADGSTACGNCAYAGFYDDVYGSSGAGYRIRPPDIQLSTLLPTQEPRYRLFTRKIKDGPLPEYYEPPESPVRNILSDEQHDPVLLISKTAKLAKPGSKEFPILISIFSLSEHYLDGRASLRNPWLAETSPDFFVELSPELANELRAGTGDTVTIFNNRGSIKAKAQVTSRIKPLIIGDVVIHYASVPWHWGSKGSAILELAADAVDPNSMTSISRSFLANITK